MKMSLKTLLIISFSFMIISSISLILFTTYFTTKTSMSKQSIKIMENISEFAIDKSINYMQVATNAAVLTKNLQKKSVINTSSIDEVIQYFYEQMIINPQFSAIYYATTEGDFIMLLKNKNGFYKKFITYEDGKRVVKKVYTDKLLNEKETILDPNDKYDPRVRPWFINAVENRGLIWTAPYVFFTSKKPGITTAIPIFNKNKNIQGVVGIDIEVDELASFINSLKISDNGKVFILDKALNLISFPIKENRVGKYELQNLKNLNDNNIVKSAYLNLTENQDITTFKKEKFISFEKGDNNYQAMFIPLKIGELEWIVGMYALEDDYLGLLKENNKLNILFIILIGLFTLYISIKVSEQIFKPIDLITKKIKELKSLNLNQKNIEFCGIVEIDELIKSFNNMKKNLRVAYVDTLHRLAVASEYKDTDTAEHINRIGLYCEVIAKELKLDENQIYILKHASAMHDIGKLGIPDRVLLKPGKLDKQEREIIEAHPAIGAAILKNPTSKIMDLGREISLYHHEKWDGTGYPKGLKGEEIPIHARIVAIVDVFDALISKRCYKEAFSFEEAKEIILKDKGKAFEPKIVDIFIECYDELIDIFKKSS